MNENTIELDNKNKLKREKNKKQNVNIFKRFSKFIKECVSELKKVSWTSKKETLKNTFIVILTVFISVLICYGFDSVISLGLNFLIKQ